MSSFQPTADAAMTPTIDLPQPKMLLFFLSHQDNYRRPLFSKNEIFCGPDTDTRIAGERTFGLKAPVGSYDVGEILNRLGSHEQPELVVIKADATRRNFPRNLARLRCPKVLIVGVTHFLHQPIRSLIEYARSEPFDRVVIEVTRHHAHWFARAGVRNLHWLPAVSFNFMPRPQKPSPSRPLTFVGQAGRHHPYRVQVLNGLRDAGLPLEITQCKPQQTADIYADSQITLNVSLNGDLNMRVFEVLSAGGFLLTDKLPDASGLPLLFESGRHLDTWTSPDNLVDRIRHYLAHPLEAQRIRAAGHAELLRAHRPDVKRRELFELVFDGKVNPRYDLSLEPRVQVSLAQPAGDGDGLLPAYEAIQEIHRSASRVTVYASGSALESITGLADLPRLRILPQAQMPLPHNAGSEVLWVDSTQEPGSVDDILSRFSGRHVIAPAHAADVLASWGFADNGDSASLRVFTLQRPGVRLARLWQAGAHDLLRAVIPSVLAEARTCDLTLLAADYAGRLEMMELYQTAVQQALSLDRNCQSALIQIASGLVDREDFVGTLLALEEAARLAPLEPGVDELRTTLAVRLADNVTVAPYLQIVHRTQPEPAAEPRRIVVATNLFPPQELGGYGRMMWEFVHGLRRRGHAVRVLCGNAGYLAKNPTPDEIEMEAHVSRSLDLTGSWRNGRTQLEPNAKKVVARSLSNARKVLDAVRKFGADIVLAGNIDFLGAELLHQVLDSGAPVLHMLANASPGYEVAQQPRQRHYAVAPCSHWNGQAFRDAGFAGTRLSTVYPGARLDRFYRLFLPDTGRLRIAYASLVMPYKGAHTLVESLGRLHQRGLDFTAEIAGDSTDPVFVSQIKEYCQRHGMADKVSFTGFLDRAGLAALFARSNVLVFPSQFPEPFGISQVEALAAGLVVVSSGTGGAREIIRDGVDGLLFKPRDSASLAEKLQSLAADGQLFSRLQQQGQLRALEFSVDRSVAKIEALVEDLIASRPVAASAA